MSCRMHKIARFGRLREARARASQPFELTLLKEEQQAIGLSWEPVQSGRTDLTAASKTTAKLAEAETFASAGT